MNNKPTPRPWQQRRTLILSAKDERQYVATVGYLGLEYPEKDLANAALIVEAVNMHDDLVKLAQEYMDLLNLLGSFDFVASKSLDNEKRKVRIAKVLMEIKE